MAGDQRLAVADDLVAHLRPHAIAADQRTAPDALARVQGQGHTLVVLLEVLDGAIGFQADEIVASAGIDEDRVQIVAVDDGIGLLEPVQEAGVVEGNPGDALARQRAAHLHCRRPMNVGEDLILEAEPCKRAEHVGAELNSGSDLAEFGCLFQHPDCHALARERIGRRQSADAAPGYQDRQLCTVALGHHRSNGITP